MRLSFPARASPAPPRKGWVRPGGALPRVLPDTPRPLGPSRIPPGSAETPRYPSSWRKGGSPQGGGGGSSVVVGGWEPPLLGAAPNPRISRSDSVLSPPRSGSGGALPVAAVSSPRDSPSPPGGVPPSGAPGGGGRRVSSRRRGVGGPPEGWDADAALRGPGGAAAGGLAVWYAEGLLGARGGPQYGKKPKG